MVGLHGSWRDKKIAELLPLVKRIALRLVRRLPSSIQVDDLIAVGNIAAIQCVDHFDASQQDTWNGYTQTRLHGAMIDYLRQMDPVSRSVHNRAQRLRQARADIEQNTKRSATRQEIADRLGLGMDDLEHFESMAIEHKFVSFDAPIDESDGESTLIEVIADESTNLNSWFDERALRQLLRRLPEREARIIDLYILKGWKLKEIGVHLGVTESRISQLIGRATKMFDQKRQDLDTDSNPLPTIRPRANTVRPARIKKSSPIAVVAPPPPHVITPVIEQHPPTKIIVAPAELLARIASIRNELHPPNQATLLREQLQTHLARLRAILS